LIVFSYIAIMAYLIFQGRGMAERNVQRAQEARDELRRVVGFSAADEIQKLDALKKAGSISHAEFANPWTGCVIAFPAFDFLTLM
jgi:hypothetical protein